MIISQTPYRVSFAGGGTDLPAFYRNEAGAVLSTAIKRHMYVTVHGRFDPTIRVAYTRTETAARVADLEHELVRESMRLLEIDEPIEITTIGDVPGGTGMGSSSSLTVGLLTALSAYRGRIVGAEQLARDACRIEIDILKKPIGRQDQYAAAYGGLNYIRFNPDSSVVVEPVPVHQEVLAELERQTLLIYTNQTRSADGILSRQSAGTADKMTALRSMRDLADEMRQTLVGAKPDLGAFAGLLHRGWELKRSLGFGISDSGIDRVYEMARKNGARGGKLLGAGGGGFVLLMAPPDAHDRIRQALGNPKGLPFQIDRTGSRVIFISENH
jgi:D-glycero-alpha-D-manno-heptose-7-phosphate kinase